MGTLKRSLQTSGIGLALAVVGTYKMGESIIDVMYKPFLIDQGISASTLGLWLGTWGMGASVLGSVLGGLLAARQPLFRMLIIVGAMRILPELGQPGSLQMVGCLNVHVIGISLAEHLIGGALTTVMFATMMGMVDGDRRDHLFAAWRSGSPSARCSLGSSRRRLVTQAPSLWESSLA